MTWNRPLKFDYSQEGDYVTIVDAYGSVLLTQSNPNAEVVREMTEAINERDALAAENAALRRALEHYTHQEAFVRQQPDSLAKWMDDGAWDDDLTQVAKQALATNPTDAVRRVSLEHEFREAVKGYERAEKAWSIGSGHPNDEERNRKFREFSDAATRLYNAQEALRPLEEGSDE